MQETAPLEISPRAGFLLVRVEWHDFFADPADNGTDFGVMPCGGHCHPSTGKVYLVDTVTDDVVYLGDQDLSLWDEGLDTEITAEGVEFGVSDNKKYIFSNQSNPLCADGSMFTSDNLFTCGQSDWVVSFLEVQEHGSTTKLIHFPLNDLPDECPLEQLAYWAEGYGECAVWND